MVILPKDIKKKIYHLIKAGKKVEAVKRVTNFTEASLRISKDYVRHI
jgi:ribosomal protein L7/L12